MLFWVFAGIAVYMVTLFAPSPFLIGRIGVRGAVGPRDALPEPSVLHARAQRAVANQQESFPIFLTLGVLTFVVPQADQALAAQGAMIAVVARLVYLPLYLMGVSWLRSAAWGVTWVGFAMMALALV